MKLSPAILGSLERVQRAFVSRVSYAAVVLVVSTSASQAERASSNLVGCSRVPTLRCPAVSNLCVVVHKTSFSLGAIGTHLPLFFLVIPGSIPTGLAIRLCKPGLYAAVV